MWGNRPRAPQRAFSSLVLYLITCSCGFVGCVFGGRHFTLIFEYFSDFLFIGTGDGVWGEIGQEGLGAFLFFGGSTVLCVCF